jgi:magnesium-transporting ATPase (P-type)
LYLRNKLECLSIIIVTIGDNILTAISVGRDCELVKPDQTIIRVEAELSTDTFYGGQHSLNVSYSLEESTNSNIVHDVSKSSSNFK